MEASTRPKRGKNHWLNEVKLLSGTLVNGALSPDERVGVELIKVPGPHAPHRPAGDDWPELDAHHMAQGSKRFHRRCFVKRPITDWVCGGPP